MPGAPYPEAGRHISELDLHSRSLARLVSQARVRGISVRDDHVFEWKLEQRAQRRQCSLLVPRRRPDAQGSAGRRQCVGEDERLKLPGTVDSVWSGDLAGTTVAVATFLIHADGSVVAAPARETFDGTLFGVRSGTLSFIEEAHSQPDGSTEIDATIIGGTGELAQLHGRVIFLGICDISGSCAGTYRGQIQG